MSKYGKYTGGQIEAILNKICHGDESVLDRLLRDQVSCVIKPAEYKHQTVLVTCALLGGSRCNICGAHFGDSASDTVCANMHVIGHQYEVPV